MSKKQAVFEFSSKTEIAKIFFVLYLKIHSRKLEENHDDDVNKNVIQQKLWY